MAQSCSASGLTVTCDTFYVKASPTNAGQDIATDIANLTVAMFPSLAQLAYNDPTAHANLITSGSGSYTSNDVTLNVLDNSADTGTGFFPPTISALIDLSKSAGNYVATLNNVQAAVYSADDSVISTATLTPTAPLWNNASWPSQLVVGSYGTQTGPAVNVPSPVAGAGLPAIAVLVAAFALMFRRSDANGVSGRRARDLRRFACGKCVATSRRL